MFIFVALLNVKDYYYEENLSIITHCFSFLGMYLGYGGDFTSR